MKSPFLRLAASAFLALLSLSCRPPLGPGRGDRALLLMSWNVLSLFDAVDDGEEYRGYSVAAGEWSEALYRRRLELIAEVVLRAKGEGRPGAPGPDILCLIEIEKGSILEDLASGPLSRCGYRWKAFAKARGSAIGIGLLSRLPLSEPRSWGLDRGEGRERPILEARVLDGGLDFRLFVNHWKSKLEGAEESEPSRIASAELLAALAGARAGEAFLACGDFNEGPDEAARTGLRYPTALLRPGSGRSGPVILAPRRSLAVGSLPRGEGGEGEAEKPVLRVFSPWDEVEGYSYMHKGLGERIDGFLLGRALVDGEDLEYRGFRVLSEGLLDEKGAPLPWSSRSGRGWSDHLPILLELGGAPP